MLNGAHLPCFSPLFQFAGGPVLAAFIHGNTQAAFAGFEQAGRDLFRAARLYIADFHFAEWAQTLLEELYPATGLVDGGFGRGKDNEVHGVFEAQLLSR